MELSFKFGKRSFRIQTGVDRGPGAVVAAASSGARMYGGAMRNRLSTDWPVTITSADSEIYVSAIALRSGLRQQERDQDYMRNMLRVFCNNVVGDQGIRLRLKARLPNGKLDKDLNMMVEEAWHEYLQEENCTVMRNRSGVEVQHLLARRLAVDGVLLFREYRGFRNDFGYAIEPIEVDRLDHWWTRPAVGTANEIRFGVEMDEFRAALAYWILTRHPGDTFAFSYEAKYREQVPASDIIPVWTIERAGQSIGMPLWPSVAKRLRNLEGYEESEQIAARAASAKGGWFSEDPATAGADEYVGPKDNQGNPLVNTEPGQWEKLPLGWKPVPNDPNHPTDQFSDFVKGQIRGASAGSGLPYPSVSSDLSDVNYSSYKAGMNEARDEYKSIQRLIATKLMRPWFRHWLPYAIMSGKLKMPIGDLDRVRTADRWKPRRWAGLEPLKEVQAAQTAVQCGFDSLRNIIDEVYDRDIEDVLDEQEHDNEAIKDHKLILPGLQPTQPAKPSKANGNGEDDEPANVNGNGNGRLHGMLT